MLQAWVQLQRLPASLAVLNDSMNYLPERQVLEDRVEVVCVWVGRQRGGDAAAPEQAAADGGQGRRGLVGGGHRGDGGGRRLFGMHRLDLQRREEGRCGMPLSYCLPLAAEE